MMIAMQVYVLANAPERAKMRDITIDESKKLTEYVVEYLASKGYTILAKGAEARYALREEAMRFSPKKVHMMAPKGRYENPDIQTLCANALVPSRRVTKEHEKVTCKLCLRRMNEADSC